VTSGDDYVAEFDGPHSRLPDFINDGSDPYDIYFLDDGRSLLADIYGSDDNVRLYHANGTLDTILFTVSFPQQIQKDSQTPGEYLNAAFSGDNVTDFDLDGTIFETTFFNGGRGVYRLGNGNFLCTAGDGVWEIEPGTGAIIEQKNTGSARFIELYSTQEVTEICITTLMNNWNFVSIPFNQSLIKTEIIVKYNDDNYTWNEAVSLSIIDANIFGWDRLSQYYIPEDILTPGYGYWIYAYQSCELWIDNITALEDVYITALKQNWNIMGIPFSQNISKTDMIVTYDFSDYSWNDAVTAGIIDPNIFGWDRQYQYYTSESILEPGYSYWMYVYQNCILSKI
jgi:hypothetical protein